MDIFDVLGAVFIATLLISIWLILMFCIGAIGLGMYNGYKNDFDPCSMWPIVTCIKVTVH